MVYQELLDKVKRKDEGISKMNENEWIDTSSGTPILKNGLRLLRIANNKISIPSYKYSAHLKSLWIIRLLFYVLFNKIKKKLVDLFQQGLVLFLQEYP